MLYVGAGSVNESDGNAFKIEDVSDLAKPGRDDGEEVDGLDKDTDVDVAELATPISLFLRTTRLDSGNANDNEGDEYEGTFRASIVAVIVMDS